MFSMKKLRFVNSVFDLVDKDGNSAMDFYELLEVADLANEDKDGAINRVEFQLFWLKIEVLKRVFWRKFVCGK